MERGGGGRGKRGNRNGVKREENNEGGKGKGSNQSYSNLGLACVVITHLHITHTTCTIHGIYTTAHDSHMYVCKYILRN